MEAFYAKIMEGNKVVNKPVEQDLGIVIFHNTKEYTLSVSNNGELIFRVVNETELLVKPKSSNSIQIG